MKIFRATLILGIALAISSNVYGQLDVLADAAEAAESIKIESLETTYDQELQIARAKGDVKIRYGDTLIEAREAEYHMATGDIFARDQVTIYRGGKIFHGEEAVYNTNTGVIVASGLRSGLDPLYFETGEVTLQADDTDVILTENTIITTHDAEKPNYKIKARKINIYPDEYIVFKNATVIIGGVPIAWLPFLAQPMDDELGYLFTPGYSDAWGPYILNQYGFLVGEHTLATAHVDYRAERGLAGGIELESMRHKNTEEFGRIEFYYAADDGFALDTGGNPRIAPDVDRERWRLDVEHRVYLPGPEKSSLYLDIDINKLSDRFFMLDFFPGEVRQDPSPDNIINLVKNHPRGTLSVLGRYQLNDFFRTDVRSPEIALDLIRQPIGNSNVFFEGELSYSVLEERLGAPERDFSTTRAQIARDRFDRLDSGLLDPSVIRFDPAEEADLLGQLDRLLDERSFNRLNGYGQLVYPMQYGGWLNLVPRAGIGYTDYASVTGNGSTISQFDRTMVHAGLDASVKFSKVYSNVHSERFGIEELRHIFQPYVRYSWIDNDPLTSDFPRIDRLTPSTKLRPLDPTRFTATDSFDDWNIVRVGAFNRLHTRRNEGSYPWLDVNTYAEFYAEDPEFDRDRSNLFNEVRWTPLPWLALFADTQIPFGDKLEFTEMNTYALVQPLRNFQFTAGHFYLQDHPFFLDSSNVRFTTYTRINDNWGFGTAHFYEFENSTMQLQQYTVHRDLTSFTAAFGAQLRDNGVGDDELGVVFSMTLKAFPRLGLPVDFVGNNNPGSGR
ncbi:MAG: LPS-assembly protein [Verrucomicrobiales bacterium]|jgi:LPS-assembly protein